MKPKKLPALLLVFGALIFWSGSAWASDPALRGHGQYGKFGPQERSAHPSFGPALHRGHSPQKRMVRQARRIRQGVRSAQITRREARSLHRQQDRIRRTWARSLADGRINRYERRQLNRIQDRASRRIDRDRHNHVFGRRHVRYHRDAVLCPVPLYPGFQRFSAGIWDSGWRFSFSVGGH